MKLNQEIMFSELIMISIIVSTVFAQSEPTSTYLGGGRYLVQQAGEPDTVVSRHFNGSISAQPEGEPLTTMTPLRGGGVSLKTEGEPASTMRSTGRGDGSYIVETEGQPTKTITPGRAGEPSSVVYSP